MNLLESVAWRGSIDHDIRGECASSNETHLSFESDFIPVGFRCVVTKHPWYEGFAHCEKEGNLPKKAPMVHRYARLSLIEREPGILKRVTFGSYYISKDIISIPLATGQTVAHFIDDWLECRRMHV